MKYTRVFLLLFLLTACSHSDDASSGCSEIRIVPKFDFRTARGIFDDEDRIGLSIAREGEPCLDNQPLTFDGTLFSASGVPYCSDAEHPATLTAYYPYRPDGVPYRFTISTDQRGGCGPSDLLGAILPDFVSWLFPVEMFFYHVFSELDIRIDNRSGRAISEVVIGGFVPEANVDFGRLSAAPVAGAPASDVFAYCVVPDEEYQVVLVPQRADLTVRIQTEDGVVRSRTVPDAPMVYGESYDLRVVLNSDAQLDVVLDGTIVDWNNGGTIGDDGNGDGTGGNEEPDPSNVLTYEGETYRIETINGKTWMAENLRYAPADATYYYDYWYPNADKKSVASLGLLYGYRTAVRGTLPSVNTTQPVQGICPDGWRIPTSAELSELAEAVPRDFFTKSGYYQPIDDMDFYPPVYNTTKIYLISSTLPQSGRVNYLRLQGTSSTSVTSLPVDRIAASLRCVKD